MSQYYKSTFFSLFQVIDSVINIYIFGLDFERLVST